MKIRPHFAPLFLFTFFSGSALTQAQISVVDAGISYLIGPLDNGSPTLTVPDHEVTGGDILIVTAACNAEDPDWLAGTVSMTYGGVPLTLKVSGFHSDNESASAIFYMMNPPVGLATLEVTFPLSHDPDTSVPPLIRNQIRMGAITFSGIDTATPFGSEVSNILTTATRTELTGIEAGNVTIYAVGGNGGLGGGGNGGALNIEENGTTTVDVVNETPPAGFFPITSIANGRRTIGVGNTQQVTGTVSYGHGYHPDVLKWRNIGACALELNAPMVAVTADPEITSITLVGTTITITMTGEDGTDYWCVSSTDLLGFPTAEAPNLGNPFQTTSGTASFTIDVTGDPKLFLRVQNAAP